MNRSARCAGEAFTDFITGPSHDSPGQCPPFGTLVARQVRLCRGDAGVLRISKLSDYGTIMLAYMAEQPRDLHSAAELAEALQLGPATVSKILKALAKQALLTAHRGANGGYALARAPEEISLAEVIDALEEQPFGLTECSSQEGNCAQEVSCVMRANWMRINDIVRQALEGVTLADMIRPPAPKRAGTQFKGVPVAVRG